MAHPVCASTRSACVYGTFIWPTIDPHRFFIRIDPNQSQPRRRPGRLLAGGGGDPQMLDTVMVVAGAAFFALAIAYVAACDRM
jgi:hypothetical protein